MTITLWDNIIFSSTFHAGCQCVPIPILMHTSRHKDWLTATVGVFDSKFQSFKLRGYTIHSVRIGQDRTLLFQISMVRRLLRSTDVRYFVSQYDTTRPRRLSLTCLANYRRLYRPCCLSTVIVKCQTGYVCPRRTKAILPPLP